MFRCDRRARVSEMRPPGKREALARDDRRHQREPVRPREPPRADVEALGDREEALSRCDVVLQAWSGARRRLPGGDGATRDPQPLTRRQHARQPEPVGAREPVGPYAVPARDQEEALARLHRVDEDGVAGRTRARHGTHDHGATGDTEPLPRREHARQRQVVRACQHRRLNSIAARDHDEALARLHGVHTSPPCGGGRRLRLPARESPKCPDAGDAVGLEPARALETPQGRRGGGVEATVDPARGQAEAPQAELERRDVPADAPARETALAEEGHAELPQFAARRHADLSRRPDPVLPLEAEERLTRHRPRDTVDRAGVEPLRAQRDLERRDPGALSGDSGPGECQGCGRNEDDHDRTTHGTHALRRLRACSSPRPHLHRPGGGEPRSSGATLPGRCLPR